MAEPLTAEDVLAHYGVKGMRWGVRRRSDGGSAEPNPLKVQKLEGRVAKTAASNEARKAKPVRRDDAIVSARKSISKANDDVSVARAQYRLEKQTKGKEAALLALRQKKLDRDITEIMNRDQASMKTNKELVDEMINDIFNMAFSTKR